MVIEYKKFQIGKTTKVLHSVGMIASKNDANKLATTERKKGNYARIIKKGRGEYKVFASDEQGFKSKGKGHFGF